VAINAEHEAGIEIRQIKYLTNIVERDHRAKRLVRPSAAVTLAGTELMQMIWSHARPGDLRQNESHKVRRKCAG
jgi:transposase-like protein